MYVQLFFDLRSLFLGILSRQSPSQNKPCYRCMYNKQKHILLCPMLVGVGVYYLDCKYPTPTVNLNSGPAIKWKMGTCIQGSTLKLSIARADGSFDCCTSIANTKVRTESPLFQQKTHLTKIENWLAC